MRHLWIWQRSPDAERPAYDTVAQAASGWLRLLINPGKPTRRRTGDRRLRDRILHCVRALGALHERQRTGRGRRIDISMLEAMCHFNLDDFTHYFQADEVMGPYSRPSVSQSYVFECADGKWIALHMSSPPKFWKAWRVPSASRICSETRVLPTGRAHRASGRPDRANGADL